MRGRGRSRNRGPGALRREARAACSAAILAGVLAAGPSGAGAPAPSASTEKQKEPKAAMSAFRALEERYFLEFILRNPVTATYLGADAHPGAAEEAASALRDFSSVALRAEDAANVEILGRLREIPAASLGPDEAVDAAVMGAQIRFVHDLTQVRRHQLRSLDTYMVEPFRGVDWQLQGMAETGPGEYGTEEDWRRVVERVRGIPDYLAVARANLKAGIDAGAAPDWRVIEKDGLDTPLANAAYFETTLPEIFEQRTRGRAWAAPASGPLRKAGAAAAAAYREFRAFVLDAYYTKEAARALSGGAAPAGAGVFKTRDLLRPEFRQDRFALGEAAYARAVKENLRVSTSLAALYDQADRRVRETQALLVSVAREVDAARGWGLSWEDRDADLRSARRVIDRLGEDAPKDDAEMIDGYRRKAQDLVAYGRRHALFALPDDYRLDVVPTPEVLRASIDGAAYYPAPPFKGTGVGRFYLTPTGNDPAHLRENSRASMAALCAHEGFPGHDWHYRFMASRAGSIGKVRWLTPGAVEDSSSMWADSMAAEGWALYAEALVAEPPPGEARARPHGFYTPEERIFQVQAQLLREARVRIDVGIHTGRMSFDEAVGYYTANVDLLPGACGRDGEEARASCETATRAVFRYSKWPTQAITYRLGKDAVLELREAVKAIRGDRFDLRAFHEQVLGAGTIPLDHVRARILEWARSAP